MSKNVTLKVVNLKGEEVSTCKLNSEVFDVEFHDQCVYDAVRVEQANQRQATAKTKNRSEVRGGGRKPWRQKGTGRARAGSTRSPIWVGGGVAFGPTGEQNYKLSQNKKEYAIAKRSVLSQAVREGQLIVVESLELESKKTKEFVAALDAINAGSKVMVIDKDYENENLTYASRNLQWVVYVDPTNVSVYEVLNCDTIVATPDALKIIEEALV